MFNFLRKKTKKEILQEQYRKLLKEAYQLSTINRRASDSKQAEAQEVLDQLEALDNDSKS